MRKLPYNKSLIPYWRSGTIIQRLKSSSRGNYEGIPAVRMEDWLLGKN